MSTDPAARYLALLLDAPLMSFGHASRFQRRTTALHPTRSVILGMICAAAGAAKGSRAEAAWLEKLDERHVRLTTLAIPRRSADDRSSPEPPTGRLEDFHTVCGTRKASGKISKDAVISHRQYLLDARFGVILAGPQEPLAAAAEALRDPVWGIWFGRKCCLPGAPVLRGLADTFAGAMAALGLAGRHPDEFSTVGDVPSFAEGTDTLMDAPMNFATRQFRPRRINVQPGRNG